MTSQELSDLINSGKTNYIENEDYVKCHICGFCGARLGYHLKTNHGWDKDRIILERSRGLKLIASNIEKKRMLSLNIEKAKEQRQKTNMERYGVPNPGGSEESINKAIETSKKRYNCSHAMQSPEIKIRHTKSSRNGPSEVEKVFAKLVPRNVVYVGYGGIFVHCRKPVRKFRRDCFNFNPDFMVFSDTVIDEVIALSEKLLPLDRKNHRSRYAIEILGNYYHSKEIIGVDEDFHYNQIMEAYASVGINCLVLWEKDILNKWNEIKQKVNDWICDAISDINNSQINRNNILNEPEKKTIVKKEKESESLEGKIVCKICNRGFDKIGWHIIREHNMSVEQYKLLYDVQETVSEKNKELVAKIVRPKGVKYKQRVVYRLPDGRIAKKIDAWRKAWNGDGPADSVIDAKTVDLNPWKDKTEGVDYVVCEFCGYKAKNLTRHMGREHVGLVPTKELKSEECKKALSEAANSAWDKRGRKDRSGEVKRVYKLAGLDRETLYDLYVVQRLSDDKIAVRYGVAENSIRTKRIKLNITRK